MKSGVNEKYLSGVETTVLCPADIAICPRCIVHYYYHNQKNLPGFMEFEVLRDSFYQTLRVCLPIALATNVQKRSENEGITLSVDHSKPNYPPVIKHVDTQCTIADMLRRDFAVESQPSAMSNSPQIVNPLNGDPLGVVDIVYMSDGVGISVALSHSVEKGGT
ncbi:hypothetical protein COEREDRAFT_82660 [Coemansia reversa NRRL 1564]|uniref:Uncharacterized protein n=1 Tax=Coemansia reversa (strain ATCC 12441 / NRRL 1564) TaxID=763665 RepID=A0A2G5B682_COERN|nr:hypothetical protein COEREDRAFT_82660 [Coemansia reversa NRRL 1564]|eukprot:PIA14515.1 hypothetical protein COEREDRAFT_82660 [Coemansia reversa NRRL 1564]